MANLHSNQNSKKPLLLRIFQLTIVTVCGFGLYWTSNFLIANNNYYHAKNIVENIRTSSTARTVENINTALNHVNVAIQYFPEKSGYYLLRAELYEWKANLEVSKRLDLLAFAFDDFTLALKYRPLWPPTWANLAAIKWKIGEIDDEFYYYLNTAIELGPQHEIVHIFVTEFGLAMFAQHSREFGKINVVLRRHIEQGLKTSLSRERIVKAIKSHNLEQEVCRWMVDAEYRVRRAIPDCVVFNKG